MKSQTTTRSSENVALHDTKIKVIVFGFSTISLLFITILGVWFASTSSSNQKMQSLVERQNQTRLLATMLYAAQRRSLSLHQMSELKDPFEQDDKYLEFRRLGELYLLQRDKLLSTALTKHDADILRKVDELANYGGNTQEKVADLIIQSQVNQAKNVLMNDVAPNQKLLIDKLRSLFESQRNLVATQLTTARDEQQNTYFFITFMAVAALLLGIFTIFVIKRSAASERRALKQSQWIRALYQISSNSSLIPDEQITETLRFGCRLLEMEIGKVCKINPEKNVNIPQIIVAPEQYRIKPGKEIPLDKTFCKYTVTSEQPVLVADINKTQYDISDCFEYSQIESYIALPLYINKRKFGTVNFSSTQPRSSFSPDEIDLLKLITNWISVTLENKFAQAVRIERESNEAADKTKNSFLANMSHELRTPLHAILGYNELLKDDISEQGHNNYLNDIEKIEVAGRHLLSLVNNVLDLSKIEAGKMDIHVEKFSLKPLIEEIESTIRPLIEKNGNLINIELDYQLDSMDSDPVKVRQILFNLLSNSAKFTDKGKIELAVSPEVIENECWIKFIVKDSGIGMTKDHVERLFAAFSQADTSIQKKFGGTGLGLAITARLCELIGGFVTAESNFGNGSTFTVLLPRSIQKNNNSQPGIATG